MKKELHNEILSNLKTLVFGENGNYTFTSKYITKILKLYFKYAFKAVVNGYPMKLMVANISLHVEPLRGLSEEEKKRYLTSNRLFGYLFHLKFEGSKINPEYTWYPDKWIMDLLQESIDSDNVYELIKT